MIDRCPICDANLAMVGRSHRCVAKVLKSVVVDVVKPNPFQDAARGRDPAPTSAPKLSDGKVNRGPERATVRAAAVRTPKGPATATNPKLGRPRKGEERDKPWLKCNPPLSRTTWYRRQKEQGK